MASFRPLRAVLLHSSLPRLWYPRQQCVALRSVQWRCIGNLQRPSEKTRYKLPKRVDPKPKQQGRPQVQKKLRTAEELQQELDQIASQPIIDRIFPKPYRALIRLDKPVGVYLLFLPCSWSIVMASYQTWAPFTQTVNQLLLFATGAFVMRNSGCIINDLWDRELDRKVERTQDRPLARGDLSVKQAVVFLGLQLSAGLLVLTQLNLLSIKTGIVSLALVAVYPAMKRFTHWPQAVLGLAFSWGVWLGWAAVANNIDWSVCVPLYAAGISWTLVYDTIYAHQDKLDDAKVGIKSTARLFGRHTKPIVGVFLATSLFFVLVSGFYNHQSIVFTIPPIAGTIWTAAIIRATDLHSPAACAHYFKLSWIFGASIFLGAFLDYFMATFWGERLPSLQSILFSAFGQPRKTTQEEKSVPAK